MKSFQLSTIVLVVDVNKKQTAMYRFVLKCEFNFDIVLSFKTHLDLEEK